MTFRAFGWALALVSMAVTTPVFAQSDGAASADPALEEGAGEQDAMADPGLDETVDADPVTDPVDETDPQTEENSGLLSDEQVIAEEQMGGRATVRSSTDPYEDPTRNYYFLGFFYHHTFMPEFILNLFTDEATGTNNPALGLSFTYRKDGFDIITSLWYQTYFVEGPFRGAGDTEFETEIIDSNLKTIFAGVTFLWGTEFNDIVSLQYGIGLGIGGVFGNMYRDEAYPARFASADDERFGGFTRCNGPSDPGSSVTGSGEWCDPTSAGDGAMGGHFGVKARNWTNGGSVPVVWFRASLPHLALRIKPIKQVMIRIEGGFDLFSGFFVGGSLNVGLGGS